MSELVSVVYLINFMWFKIKLFHMIIRPVMYFINWLSVLWEIYINNTVESEICVNFIPNGCLDSEQRESIDVCITGRGRLGTGSGGMCWCLHQGQARQRYAKLSTITLLSMKVMGSWAVRLLSWRWVIFWREG